MTSTRRAASEPSKTTAGATSAAGLPVLVFDVSSLRFRRGPRGRTVTVTTQHGQHLATAVIAGGATPAQQAYAALEEALRSSRILRPVLVEDAPQCPIARRTPAAQTTPQTAPATGIEGPAAELVAHRVALYNPLTAETACYDAAGRRAVFSGSAQALRPEGSPLSVSAADQAGSTAAASTAADGLLEMRTAEGDLFALEREATAAVVARAMAICA